VQLRFTQSQKCDFAFAHKIERYTLDFGDLSMGCGD